jgi:hypothetical protein
MKLPLHVRKLSNLPLVVTAVVLAIVAIGVFALGRHATELRESGVAGGAKAPALAHKLQVPTLASAAAMQSSAAHNCIENGDGKLLVVSIGQQHLWACDGTALVKDTVVTTGASDAPKGVDDSTPTGTWRIYSKQADRYLNGCDVNGCWHDYVQYWLPFDGSVGFHDASWQTFPFGSAQYQTDGSHGCVHLPTDFIAWLYAWAPVGTTVTVE